MANGMDQMIVVCNIFFFAVGNSKASTLTFFFNLKQKSIRLHLLQLPVKYCVLLFLLY